MIKFRGQRLDNGGIVEGYYFTNGLSHGIIHGSSFPGAWYEINPATLQAFTTEGWADIADVEVVRKKVGCKHDFPDNVAIWKWWQTQNFQKEQGEQEYTMIYEIDLPKILKAFFDSVATITTPDKHG